MIREAIVNAVAHRDQTSEDGFRISAGRPYLSRLPQSLRKQQRKKLRRNQGGIPEAGDLWSRSRQGIHQQ